MSNFFDRPELKRNFFDDAPEPVRPAPTESPKLSRTGFVDSAVRGFKRSLPETKSLLAGAGAAVAGAVGADGLRDKALDYYQEVQKEEVEPLANQASFMGVLKGDDSLGEWAGDTLGNFGGQALQSLAAAGAGAVVGSAAPGAGTVGGAAAGLVARPLLKRVIGKEVAEMVAEGAAKDAIGKATLKRAGMIAAPTAMNIGQETGIAYTGRAEDAAAAGEELTQTDAMRAIAAGIPAGLLDTAAEAYAANRFLRGASESPSLVRRVAAGALKGSVTEAGTEAAQAVLERAGAARNITGEDAYLDYIENAAAGAFGGGVAGGGSGLRRSQPQLTRGPQPPPAAQPDPLALPPPDGAPGYGTIRVAPDGTAITEPQRAGIDAQNEATGLTPDVEAARAAHPGATPNTVPLSRGPRVPFEGAAPGSLADAVNATSEAAQGAQVDAKTKALQEWHGLFAGLNGAAVPSGSPLAMEMDRRRARAIELGATEDELNGFTQPDALVSDPDGLTPLAQRADAAPLGSLADAVKDVPAAPALAAGAGLQPQGDPAQGSALESPSPGRMQSAAETSPQTPAATPVQPEVRSESGSASSPQSAPANTRSQPAVAEEVSPEELAALKNRNRTPAAVEGDTWDTAKVLRESPVGHVATQIVPQSAENPDGGRRWTKQDDGRWSDGNSIVDTNALARMLDREDSDVLEGTATRTGTQPKLSAPSGAAQAVTPAELAARPVGGTLAVGNSTWTKQADGRWSNGASYWSNEMLARVAAIPAAAAPDATSPAAAAAMEAATSPDNDLKPPSEAQLEAGNFKVGRTRVNGLEISIEHPAGVKRKAEHSQALSHPYGYIRRTEGADGEKVDVFLGDRANDTSLPVFVVDQKKADGSFDESKVMLGFETEANARDAYLSNYPKGWEKSGLGAITQMTQDEFKAWVKDPAKTALPAAAPRSTEPGTAEQEAPGAAIEDEIRPAGKKRDRGFTSAASVTAAITERGLSPDDYEVKQTELGGFIGVRKAPEPSRETVAPKNEPKPTSTSRKEQIASILDRGGRVVDGELRQQNGQAMMRLTDDELAAVPDDRKTTSADIARRRDEVYPNAKRLVDEAPNGIKVGDRVLVDESQNAGTSRSTEPYEGTVTAIQINAAPVYGGTAFKVSRDDATQDGRGSGWVGIDRVSPAPSNPEHARNMVEKEKREAEQAREELHRGFPKEAELAAKRERSAKVVAALRAGKRSVEGDPEPAQKFSRRDPAARDGAGQRAQDVRRAIAPIVSRWGASAPEVVVVDTAHDLPQVVRSEEGWRDAEGWYDDRTGTVYLVAGNLTSDDRARRVLAHEAVGHYGIEAIVGEAQWSQIRDTVYRMMQSGQHQALFAELARRYRGVNEPLFVREAVAVMAEKGMGGGVVNRVIAAIRRFLRGIGFDLEFSERELRDLIGKSARYLRNGRRPRVALEAGQAMAFAARPDRDWNATVPVVGIAGGTFGDTNSIRQARAAAKNYLMRLRDSGRLMTNADTGWKIGLSRASINELTQFGQEKLNLLIALPRITNVAVLADSAPNRNPAAHGESIVAYHTLYAPVALNGEPRIARLVVQEHAGGRYAFDLQQSSVLNAQGPAGVARFPGVESGARRPGEAHAWTVGQLRDAVNAVDRKGWAFSHPSQDSMKDSEGVEYAHAEEALQSRLAQWAAEIHLGGSGPRAVGASPEAIGTVARNGSGAAHQGDASREEIRTQSARLIERAKAEGFFWDSDHPILARLDTLPVLGGAEHRVFVVGSGDARFVIRATDNGFFGPRSDISPAQYLARLDDFNSTFPSLQTRLIGVSESADIPGHAVIWTAQPFVYGKKFSSQDALREGMVARGWQEDGYPGVPRYRHTASGAVIEDAHIDNVFHDEDGNLYPFDVVVAEMPTSGGLKFSRPDPEKTLEAMDARTVRGSVFDALRTWWNRGPISSAVENTRPAWLGALTLRHLAELGNDIHLKQVDAYAKRVQQMTTDRNALQEAGAKVAEIWEKFQRTDRAGADATANLMHDTTIAAVDPSRAYVPLMTGATKRGGNEAVTAESIARRIAMVDADLDADPSDQIRRGLVAERAALEALLAEERQRQQAYPELVRRYQALPEKGREVYEAARKVYDDQSKALRDAIIARVKDAVEDGAVREAYVMQVRQTFEDARVRGPYFPLARFGEFWINAEKDGKQAFFMYENVQEWRAGQTDLARRGYVVKEAGRKIAEARSVAGVSSAFMADLEGVLKQSGADKQVMDDVWQMYLRTLPDLSMRKHFIHRKKVEGYSGDALRAFSGNVFHGSYQIARVRHSHKLVELLDSLKKATAALAGDDPERAAKAAALTTELGQRHEWVMNPKDSKAVSWLTSLGFVWYLGATPAAAAINLTQTAIVTFPVLASRFGVAKAWNTLAAATGRALRNVNGDLTRGLNDEERAAFALWEKSGAIDRTMTHNLVGLSETDTRSFNPVARRTMELVSWMFHKAEVVNRAAAALAAFRLARDAGQDFHTAAQYAADVVTESNYDYTNANRARWMQSNAAKVFLLFRQYSLNMTWLLWRNFYLGTKGETPAVRKEARKKLAGVLGMTALFSGVMGLPLMGLMFDLANAAAAAFGDDDEPFDAEVEFRNFLADLLGPDLARFITQGPIESLTGIEFGSRVGLNELWLRSPDRELEGQAMADYLLEQAAGPVVGGMLVNTLDGAKKIADGHTWRGVETMAPKSVKDAMKALRYGKEGVNTMRGDPLIEDLSLGETLMQLAGFSPAAVTEQYDANSAAKNYEQRILNRRRALLNAYAMAWRNEDTEGITKALGKIRAWNEKHPQLGITVDTIRRSLANRMRYSARAESGVVLDRRIAEDAREQARFSE